jgi:hypothetical protein
MKVLDVPSSGSYQGLTHSRNRFGQYVRSRATPVNPGSSYQAAVRARQSTSAASWRGLTALQRTGWTDLGAQIFRADSLGQYYNLTGFQAFCSVNNNLAKVGDARVAEAPALLEPTSIDSVTPTVTAATFSVAFTVTPAGAAERVLAYASQMRSPGRAYEGDLRFIAAGAAATVSPLDIFSAWSVRFGTPVLGTRIFVAVARYKGGFISPTLFTSVLVTA